MPVRGGNAHRSRALAGRVDAGHIVQFYEDDAFLCDSVAHFLATGLASGETAIVIADDERRDDLCARLDMRGFDVSRAQQNGALTLIDARATLTQIVCDGEIDREAFDRVVGAQLNNARSARPHAPLRAYGEMVDILVAGGNTRGALALERLWNEVAARESFALLCAYSMSHFSEARDALVFRELCVAHDHVCPTERYSGLTNSDAQMQEIAELQQRAISLESALRVRDEFLSVAGHELRTPVTALRLQLQMLARRPGDSSLVGRAEHQVSRLADLIERLLEVTRMSGGPVPLERVDADLTAIARDVIEATDGAREGCEILLHAVGPVMGSFDAKRIEQVVTNVISNAIKYGRRHPIDVRVERTDSHVRLSVRDHGIGVSEADQRRIFDRFERAVSGTEYGGLGLGLWISKQIVEAHGGRLSLESHPEQGSVFTMELPS